MVADTFKIGGKEYSVAELRVLEKAGVFDNIGQKNDPASTALTAPALHGYLQGNANQAGAFSYPGVRPERFSAQMHPRSILKTFGLTKSEFTDNLIEIQTGQTAPNSTTNAEGWCGNPPTVGALKTCQQIYKFGQFYGKTNLNAIPEIGKLRNRADVSGRLLNVGPRENPLIPELWYTMTDTRSTLHNELYLLGNQAEIDMEKVLWNGAYSASIQNNYYGWMHEFAGLSGQVKNTYTDAVSGAACGAANSIVESFGANITGTDALGRDIVEALTDHYYAVKQRATAVGMDGVQFVIAMSPEQFRAVVDVWACSYATYRCQSSQAGEPVTRDGMAIQNLRVEMFGGQYLLIDGERVPVILSDGITVDRLAVNTYQSDIFILPVSWGATPLIYIEYFPMDNQYATEYANNNGFKIVDWMNNGLYIVGKRDTGLCLEWLFGAQMRVILETPFLASRLDDVTFSYFSQTRRADPGVTWAYANGGRSYVAVPTVMA